MAFLDTSGLTRFFNKCKQYFAKDSEVVKSINGTLPSDGAVNISRVDYADNLVSDDAQNSSAEFIARTTGGDASISDGSAWLVTIGGNSVRSGYIEGSINMTVTPVETVPRSNPITAQTDKTTFKNAIREDANVVLIYSDSWNITPSTYGVSITGSPYDGDTIVLTYTKESDTSTIEVRMTEDEDRSGTISATLNETTFKDAILSDEEMTFSYGVVWDENLSSYGVTVTNAPVYGDSILVTYIHSTDTLTTTVNAVQTQPRTNPITATIDKEKYQFSDAQEGVTVFTYTTEWNKDLDDYGIAVTNQAVNGDTISVDYVKESRGVIKNAQLGQLKSTNWNLYNYLTGVARALKYSTSYGFIVGGGYTTVKWAADINATEEDKITIEPVDYGSGMGFIPANELSEDGYFWVSGGNPDTTYVIMTWSDWQAGPQSAFARFDESEIDFTSLTAVFPYGFNKVGQIRDEIDVTLNTYTRRIDRMDYNQNNLKTAKSNKSLYGLDYIYDDNYIYAVLAEPVTGEIRIDNEYTASDHGIEYFTGTEVPIFMSVLYGQNLKDKLRTDVVTISSMDLTDSQKESARANINAASGSYYAVCDTAGNVAAKAASCPGYKRETGARILVRFTNKNTLDGTDITLNINNTGAAAIKRSSTSGVVFGEWNADEIVEFVFDGIYYRIVDGSHAGSATWGNVLLSDVYSTINTEQKATNGIGASAWSVQTAYVNSMHLSGSQDISGTKTFKGTPIMNNHATGPLLYFESTAQSSATGALVYYNTSGTNKPYAKGRFGFRQYSPTTDYTGRTGKYEVYYLPEVKENITINNVGYDILTTKDYASSNESNVVTWNTTNTNSAECSSQIYRFGKLRVLLVSISSNVASTSITTVYGKLKYASDRPAMTSYASFGHAAGGDTWGLETRQGQLLAGGDIRMSGSKKSSSGSSSTYYYATFTYMAA